MTHSYLRWPSDRPDRQSWHVLAKVDETGWHLRCGRVITTDEAAASDHIPSGEKSCESCLRGTLRDEST
jgi:hypothetical protein